MTAFVLPLFVTFVINSWWEEVAWMGFVQRRSQHRRGPVLAAVMTGVLFALQHVSLVTGWMYNSTGSLFLVGLTHAVGNAVAGGSGFHAGYLAASYPGQPIAALAHLLAFALIGMVVLVATRGRLGMRRGPDRPTS